MATVSAESQAGTTFMRIRSVPDLIGWMRSPQVRPILHRVIGVSVILFPLLIWAASLWPAVFVADSSSTWQQAVNGPVVNWHPPVYTYLQRLSYSVVGSPSGVIVLQSLAMAVSLSLLLELAVALGARRRYAYSFGFFVALMPSVGAFTAHLIKDVPYTIGFLLVIWYVFREGLMRLGRIDNMPIRRMDEVTFVAALLLILLLRVNGVLVFPGIVLAVLVTNRNRLRSVALLGSSLFLFFAVTKVLYPQLDVRPPPDNLRAGVFVFDLGALYQSQPDDVPLEVVDDLSLYGTQSEYRDGFNCHWTNQPFHNNFYKSVALSESQLRHAWISTVESHPLFIIGNHLCAASAAWNPFAPQEEQANRQTVWDVVVANDLGVRSDPVFDVLARWRNQALDLSCSSGDAGPWGPTRPGACGLTAQFLLWRAPTWMYVLAILLIAGAIRTRERLPLIILVIFAAQAASVIAITGPHYRYMAPAWIGAVFLIPTAIRLILRESSPELDHSRMIESEAVPR